MQEVGADAEANGQQQPEVAFYPRPEGLKHSNDERHDISPDYHSAPAPGLTPPTLDCRPRGVFPPRADMPAPIPPPAGVLDEGDNGDDAGTHTNPETDTRAGLVPVCERCEGGEAGGAGGCQHRIGANPTPEPSVEGQEHDEDHQAFNP